MFGDVGAELLVRIGIKLTGKTKDQGLVSFLAAPPQGHGQALQFSDWSSSLSIYGRSVVIPRRWRRKILISNCHGKDQSPLPWMTSTALCHQGNEASEVVVRVVGTWTGFWVVLDTEGRLIQQAQGSHRPVVEIVVGDPYLSRR